MKTKRSFEYYKNLFTELKQPFLCLPSEIHGNPETKVIVCFPTSSMMFDLLPSTTPSYLRWKRDDWYPEVAMTYFDYDEYDQEPHWDEDTVEYIQDYHDRNY